eukprot:7296463-Pyramimonas_sp.AAC.1
MAASGCRRWPFSLLLLRDWFLLREYARFPHAIGSRDAGGGHFQLKPAREHAHSARPRVGGGRRRHLVEGTKLGNRGGEGGPEGV